MLWVTAMWVRVPRIVGEFHSAEEWSPGAESGVVCVVRLKSDDKYNMVLPRLVSLLNIVSELQSHIQAQESIAVCIHE